MLPEYRRRGIGEILQGAAINNAIDKGRYVYGQVIEGNDVSLKLQRKLGMTLCENKVYWLLK